MFIPVHGIRSCFWGVPLTAGSGAFIFVTQTGFAGIILLLMVIEKILKGNGKEEIAVLANLAGIIIILITVIGMISNLFDTVRTMFSL